MTRYDFEGLVLLAIFELSTGRELDWSEVQTWADQLGCRTPTVYPFGNLEDVLASRARLPSKLEGYVIRFASGFRVKVKGDAYLALHKLAEPAIAIPAATPLLLTAVKAAALCRVSKLKKMQAAQRWKFIADITAGKSCSTALRLR